MNKKNHINISKEELQEVYNSSNSLRETSKKLNCSSSTVFRLLKKYEMKIVTQSECKLENKNPMWKGELAGLDALHRWVGRRKPKPEFCEYCNKTKPRDLANISGKYKRDVDDFEWLCTRCHMTKDGRLERFKKIVSKYTDEQRKQLLLDYEYCRKNKIPIKSLEKKYNSTAQKLCDLVNATKRFYNERMKKEEYYVKEM